MLKETKERLVYLDLGRGLAMIAVILCHIYNNNMADVWFCSFHVPLFFIISGCLIRYTRESEKSIGEILIKKIKNIIFPYITFNIVYICFSFIAFDSSRNIFSLKSNIISTVIMRGCGALWFLPALFIAEIGFIVLNKFYNKEISISNLKKVFENNKKHFIIEIMCILYILFIGMYNYKSLMLVLIRGTVGLIFTMIGYYTFNFINRVNINGIVVFILLVASIIISQFNGIVDLYSLIFNNVFLYVFCSLLGSYSVILLLKKVKSNKILMYFGTNSLILMSIHQNILWCTVAIMKRLIVNCSFEDYLSGTFIFLVIMLIQLPIIYIINKYAPWMLGKFKKREKLQKNTKGIFA